MPPPLLARIDISAVGVVATVVPALTTVAGWPGSIHHRDTPCRNASQRISRTDCRGHAPDMRRPAPTRQRWATATSGIERGGKPCSPVMRGSAGPAAASALDTARPTPITSCRLQTAVIGTASPTASAFACRAIAARRERRTRASRRARRLHRQRPRLYRLRHGRSTDDDNRGEGVRNSTT